MRCKSTVLPAAMALVSSAVWVPGHWTASRGGWVWAGGHWAARSPITERRTQFVAGAGIAYRF